MMTRQMLMKAIARTFNDAKNAHTRDLRFEALDRLALLQAILCDVTNFEKQLLADLDVD